MWWKGKIGKIYQRDGLRKKENKKKKRKMGRDINGSWRGGGEREDKTEWRNGWKRIGMMGKE